MDVKILEAVRNDSEYTYEAYEFICNAVTYTQERLGRNGKSQEAEENEHHISALELLRGTVEYAIREFGMMAPVVFEQWKVTSTTDIGLIVFRLIKVDRLSKSDRDNIYDFKDAFDLPLALKQGYAMPAMASAGRKWGER